MGVAVRRTGKRIGSATSLDGVTRLAILAVCFGLGALGGFLFSALSGDSVELMDYLQQYFQSAGQGGGLEPSLAATVWDLVRWPLAAFLLGLVPLGAVGVPLLGWFTKPASLLLWAIAGSVVMLAAFCAIFTFVAMNCSRKATSVVICLLGVFVLLIVTVVIDGRLNAPEFIQGYEMSFNGQVVDTVPEPNPRYLRGTERAVYQFLYDLLPTGQSLQYTMLNFTEPGKLMGLSGLVCAVFTGAGAALFRRKDLK